jgi:hypothetical protein
MDIFRLPVVYNHFFCFTPIEVIMEDLKAMKQYCILEEEFQRSLEEDEILINDRTTPPLPKNPRRIDQ